MAKRFCACDACKSRKPSTSELASPKSEVEKARAAGNKVLLELDVKGALNVRSKLEDALLVFVMPPSLEVLEARLRKRDREGEEDIGARTREAEREIETGRAGFDVVIVNDDVDEAAAQLLKVIREEPA